MIKLYLLNIVIYIVAFAIMTRIKNKEILNLWNRIKTIETNRFLEVQELKNDNVYLANKCIETFDLFTQNKIVTKRIEILDEHGFKLLMSSLELSEAINSAIKLDYIKITLWKYEDEE